MIKNNAHKHSVSAMCRALQIPRSTYYYEAKRKPDDSDLVSNIKTIFKESRNNYGALKIKKKLYTKFKLIVSKRKIRRIMKQEGLISSYQVAKYKPHKDKCNESKTANLLKRNFNTEEPKHAVVSDLTYVRVGSSWNYICVFIDLFNREIIGYSAGQRKDAVLVSKAFATIEGDLSNIQIFHTDRGNEFKNKLIDDTLETFSIQRSLSMKGCPYDNAVAEATYKIIKTEFVKQFKFKNIEQLRIELADYVNWFNNHRIHSSLDYLTPKQYKDIHLKKVV